MKKILCLVLVLLLMVFMAIPGYASELSGIENGKMTGDVYAKYVNAVEKDKTPLQNGSAIVVTDEDHTVSISGAPANAAFLRVVSIPYSETEAWNWIVGCVSQNITVFGVWGIYFEDVDGNRINASGVPIAMTAADEETAVFAVSTTGNAMELDSTFEGNKVSFVANGSPYYVLSKKADESPADSYAVTVDNTNGGSVVVSSSRPKAGDVVIITVTPDAGKTIDEILIKDSNGKKIVVTENKDRTYSYVQPDSDVTIYVAFENKVPSSGDDNPKTGDDNIMVGILCLNISAMVLWWLIYNKRWRICEEH